MPSILRAHGLLAVGIGLGFIACDDAELVSDLTSEGPPEVLTVTVQSESLNLNNFSNELATFCSGDEDAKLNQLFCPDGDFEQVQDAIPTAWAVRVVFDELLDGDAVEEVIRDDNGVVLGGTIINTQPVTLQCNDTPIAYDGFYDPTGSHLTDPAGPSLFVFPLDFIATGSTCSISLEGLIVDKDGEVVPMAQRGPYGFGIAPLRTDGTDPEDEAEGIDPTSEVLVFFNAPIDESTIGGLVTVTDGTGADVPVDVFVDDTVLVITAVAGLAENTAYTVSLQGTVADIAGGALEIAEAETFTFTTGTVME